MASSDIEIDLVLHRPAAVEPQRWTQLLIDRTNHRISQISSLKIKLSSRPDGGGK